MTSLRRLALAGTLAAALGVGAVALQAQAFRDGSEARAALASAQRQAALADRRGTRLEREARAATQAAERTAREAAALAARIQQAEAGIAEAEARLSLIDGQRDVLQRRLAERREPLVRLTASLQKFARRPLALSALKPGSLRETVYLRALIETTVPQVRARTAALRTEIARGEALERRARQVIADLDANERTLAERRERLAAIEARQRIESRRMRGAADRENERALALAEEARDLDALLGRLDEAGSLRAELAALPGPVVRPRDPGAARTALSAPRAERTGAPQDYQLPVAGRTVAGFGSAAGEGMLSQGISIAPLGSAQIIAPAAGRVAFAGPFRGYGRIVIIEHPEGWTSLVTGLARTDVAVGDELVGGAPLGVSQTDEPLVTLELRRGGEPVNPLDHVG
jgi:septal ring factor EnvC (AmiA/AmiB activator)